MVNLFSLAPSDFCWATGIEDTFIAHTRPGFRALDKYHLTQHYSLWQSDFDLVAQTGVQAVRWGIPWHRVQPKPNQWDWRWTDEALEYLVNVKRITPILDLMHYGTPLWLDNSFINARYPMLVAEYARAVAERYKSLVRYYTPLNEPIVNADWCGHKGVWPPYLKGDDGFVKMLLALAKGIVFTVRALEVEQPEMITVQVEALWRFWSQDESLQALIARHDAKQYICFDLCTGRVDDRHPLYDYLILHGTTEDDLRWFRDHAVRFDIFGANFYPWAYGEQVRKKDGSRRRLPRRTNGAAIAGLIADTYARYQMPIMVTETSAKGDHLRRARWMDETIGAVRALRQQGIPVVGYTWFPMFTMFDWEYRTGRRPLVDYTLHLGLYEAAFDAEGVFRRYETPLVGRFQEHIATPMPEVPGSEAFAARSAQASSVLSAVA
jgi:beta-glucosidase/6-phospho-beta-glucosidase/beta-galactosidase